MSNYVNDALLDASPYKKQQDEAKALVNKWDKTGLLDGLNEDFQRNGMAVMLENQAKQLIQENSGTSGQAGGAAAAAGSEEWSGVALPLVRRIFGELAAQDFVSVQPMNLPSGLVFYLDFKYGKTTDQGIGFGTNPTNSSLPGGDVNSLGGKTGPNNPSGSVAPFGVGGLYGEGRYDYSINHKNTSAIAIANVTSASANYKNINFNQEFSASLAAGELFTIDVPLTNFTNPDKKAVRSYVISGSTGDISSSLPQFTKVDGNNVRFVVSGSSTMLTKQTLANVSVGYVQQPTEANRGDFEDTAGDATTDTLAIPEVDLQLKSQAIVAKTRKLKAVWSPELAQDLNAYHSVDAEAELTSMLSEYISMEIDLEILDMLMLNASAKNEKWSARPGYEYDSATDIFVQSSGESNAYTKGTWFQTLGNKIQAVSNAIHQKTLRGGANFLVVSPETATIIESIPGYAADTNGDATNSQFAMGVQKVGALNNRYTVYKNPYMLENQILVGFRGQNFLETGAVYAPYVPLIMTPLVYDPKNFTPRKGVMTRYAKKMVRPEFYGKVVVADVDMI